MDLSVADVSDDLLLDLIAAVGCGCRLRIWIYCCGGNEILYVLAGWRVR